MALVTLMNVRNLKTSKYLIISIKKKIFWLIIINIFFIDGDAAANALKNKNADFSNPNVFIDDGDNNKVIDHVYDEIKHKDPGGNFLLFSFSNFYCIFFIDPNVSETEYDHLNYTRPATSWRPQYQRTANGLQSKKENNLKISPSASHESIDSASRK